MIMIGVFLLFSKSGVKYTVFSLLAISVGIVSFRPTILAIYDGQLSGLFFLILVSVIVLWERGKWDAGAFILTFTALKPNLGGLILVFAGLWLLSQKKWASLLWMTVGCLLILGIGFLKDLTWINSFLHAGTGMLMDNSAHTPTVWGIAGMICKFDSLCSISLGVILAGILFLVGVYLLMQKNIQLTPGYIVAIAVTFMLLITPYAWAYDQTFLIIPILLATGKLIQAQAPFLITATIFLWIDLETFVLLFVAARLVEEVWFGILPLTCLLVILWSLQAGKRWQPYPRLAT